MGQMVSGIVQRGESGATTVSLGNVEAILPRGEQIPGETHHANERVRATVFDVKKQGSRVKVILSRTRPQLVQRLFEQEIPEIADGVITIEVARSRTGLPQQGGRQQFRSTGRLRRGLRRRARQPHQEYRGRTGRRADRYRPLERRHAAV